MKTYRVVRLTFACYLLIAWTWGFSGSAWADSYDIYLLAGQSNMDGRGQVSELTLSQRRPLSNAIIYYRNPPRSSDGWKPLAPGFSIPPKYKGGFPSPTFGPEIGFANAILQAAPHQKIALIKGSKGGTSLRVDWNPGESGKPETQGECYRNFCETIRLATEDLKRQNHDFHIQGLLWHQGEADKNSNPETYQERFHVLVDRIKKEVGVDDLPVVVGEVFDNGKRDKVRTALQAIGNSGPPFGFVSSQGTKTWDEGTHFDAASQLLLGQRYADAVLRLKK
ncbi:hypothetical protein Q31b_04430 [Novipirellula aureliae]|uniref:Sialate O-acetylesterase domain-containing protein n=1 Tax=Novipirellula aureliae TaxID=2527966 RepID=A0A5C6E8I2_9BACT|nr:sialate O-acetylesterase [Novipirellula aureliae]TWU45272.1 hypothetical protein Q31b_04430 [Novipirellula aureliae]